MSIQLCDLNIFLFLILFQILYSLNAVLCQVFKHFDRLILFSQFLTKIGNFFTKKVKNRIVNFLVMCFHLFDGLVHTIKLLFVQWSYIFLIFIHLFSSFILIFNILLVEVFLLSIHIFNCLFHSIKLIIVQCFYIFLIFTHLFNFLF